METSITVKVPNTPPSYRWCEVNLSNGIYKIFNKFDCEVAEKRVIVINKNLKFFVDLKKGVIDTFDSFAWDAGDRISKVEEEINIKLS